MLKPNKYFVEVEDIFTQAERVRASYLMSGFIPRILQYQTVRSNLLGVGEQNLLNVQAIAVMRYIKTHKRATQNDFFHKSIRIWQPRSDTGLTNASNAVLRYINKHTVDISNPYIYPQNDIETSFYAQIEYPFQVLNFEELELREVLPAILWTRRPD
jgi:hypothetical protein